MADFFDYDPLSGALESIVGYDELTKTLTIRKDHTNVDAVMDAAAIVRNDGSEAWRGADKTMWHVGTVPEKIWKDWMDLFNAKRFGADKIRSYLDPDPEWQAFWWRELASSDYYKFRLTPKRL